MGDINLDEQEKEEVYLDRFGFPVEVGDECIVADRHYTQLKKRTVSKITAKTIFIGSGTYGRRAVSKCETESEIINVTKIEKKLQEYEIGDSERNSCFREDNMGEEMG